MTLCWCVWVCGLVFIAWFGLLLVDLVVVLFVLRLVLTCVLVALILRLF